VGYEETANAVSIFTAAASTPLLGHLLLAFPTGRLASIVERGIAISVYLVAFGLMPLRKMFIPGGPCGCRNLLLIRDNPTMAAFLGHANAGLTNSARGVRCRSPSPALSEGQLTAAPSTLASLYCHPRHGSRHCALRSRP
jgi:hypothetical protein